MFFPNFLNTLPLNTYTQLQKLKITVRKLFEFSSSVYFLRLAFVQNVALAIKIKLLN